MSTLSSEIIAAIFGQFEDFLRKVGKMDIFDTLVYNYRLKLSISNLNSDFISLFSELLDKLTDLRNNLIQWNSIQEFTFSIASPTPCISESSVSTSTFPNIVGVDDNHLHKVSSSSPPLTNCFSQPIFVDSNYLVTHEHDASKLIINSKLEQYTDSAPEIQVPLTTQDDHQLVTSKEKDQEITTKEVEKVIPEAPENVQVKKFLCHFCPKQYSTTQSLKAHLNVHNDSKKFSCQFCSKTFSRKDKKTFHESIHTGLRSFTCEVCGKGFYRKTKLDEHLRRHIGLKKYKCTTCKKSYASNRDLRNHVKSHEIQKPNDDENEQKQEVQPMQPIVQEDDITSQVSEIFNLNWSELQFPPQQQVEPPVDEPVQMDYNIVKQPYY